jgi:N-acetyl-gamma-glutamyl-phosphate reductase
MLHSVTGYSGGGKQMIAEYEDKAEFLLEAPRHTRLAQAHKHCRDKKSPLLTPPAFQSDCWRFLQRMTVTVPLFAKQLAAVTTLKASDRFLPRNTRRGGEIHRRR